MTRVISVSGDGARALFAALAIGLALLAVTAAPARGMRVLPETPGISPGGREPVGTGPSGRIVVQPTPPWCDWDGHSSHGRLRVQAWVDRGEWATYCPGDPLAVYFRVSRPCYVTIVDYAPDGSVSIIYPNRWSGSGLVQPGRVHRVPESRRFSLRIAGSGGIETLVVCAHEVPWPSGPGGTLTPPCHPWGRRVVVGHPRRRPPTRGRGIVVLPGDRCLPVPPAWHGRPDDWDCATVSFRVEDDHGWHGALPIPETFTMRRPADVFTRELYDRGEAGTLRIACVESSHGSPTEIAAHVAWDSGWGSRPLFRIDVDGRHGDRPRRGKRFIEMVGDLRVEVEILDVKMIEAGPWRPERIDWIRFAVRVERA